MRILASIIIFRSSYIENIGILLEGQNIVQCLFQLCSYCHGLKHLFLFFTKIQVTKNKKNLTADIILFDFGKELGFYGSNIGNFQSPRDNSTLRWTVDELKDFIFINEIYSTLYVKNPEFDTQDILDLLKLKPSLIKINQDILRNEGMIKSLKKDKRFLDFLS